MELRHLRYFLAVAEAGSLTKAADKLRMQQPPLGQQIKALEAELGVELFDRRPKRLVLNAAGQVFLEGARRTLASAEDTMEHVRRFATGERGLLRVGYTSSASFHRLTPSLVRAFHAAYPQAQVDVEESETYALILGLQQKRIDCAVLRISAERFPGLASHVLDEEEMVAAIPADHPLAVLNTPLRLADIAAHDVVSYQRTDGPGIFNGVIAQFEAAGLLPTIVVQVPRLVAALNLVAAGRGITFVPATMGILHQDAIAYRPLARGVLTALPLCIAYRQDTRLHLVQRFLDVALGLRE